jgi:hypothetical protein
MRGLILAALLWASQIAPCWASGAQITLMPWSPHPAGLTTPGYGGPTSAQRICANRGSSCPFLGTPPLNDLLVAICYSDTAGSPGVGTGWTSIFATVWGAGSVHGTRAAYFWSTGSGATFTPCTGASSVLIYDLTNLSSTTFSDHYAGDDFEQNTSLIASLSTTVNASISSLFLNAAGVCAAAATTLQVTSFAGPNGADFASTDGPSGANSCGAGGVTGTMSAGGSGSVTANYSGSGGGGNAAQDVIRIFNP